MDEQTQKWIDENCLTLEEALQAVFSRFWETETGHVKAECCRKEVKYWTGICGPDMARCEVCGAEIRHILSPHTSPLLMGQGCVYIPTDELIDAVGEKVWCVSKRRA